MKNCPQCHTVLPTEARFCLQCGAVQAPVLAESNTKTFDWDSPWVPQAYKRFQIRLEERVIAEQAASKLSLYQERMYEVDYRETVQRRLQQWSDTSVEDAVSASERGRILRVLIDDLLDFFFIIHCADLNIVVLPELILKYQNLVLEQIDLAQLAAHYLDFEREDERVYTDFIQTPVNKIRNAGQYFLFPERDEKIWFICDQSLLGNAKEGFAMTEKALYWKTGFQKAQCVYYHKLASLEREKEWLLINELYFNATPSLNTKMIWLLRKLARLFSANM